jgi:hypothetical protein
MAEVHHDVPVTPEIIRDFVCAAVGAGIYGIPIKRFGFKVRVVVNGKTGNVVSAYIVGDRFLDQNVHKVCSLTCTEEEYMRLSMERMFSHSRLPLD